MRILHVTDHFPPVMGGIETHVAELARRQAERGDEVIVLTSTPVEVDGYTAHDVDGVRVVRVGSVRAGLAADVWDVDLVQAHVSVVAPFTSPLVGAKARAGVPTLVTVHSLWGGLGPVPGWHAMITGLRGAPVHWSAVSSIAATEVGRQVPAGALVHVVPNAVEVAPRPETLVHDGPVRLVTTMRLAARKRPLPLVRALARVRRLTDQPFELTVVGDGPQRARVERSIARHDLDDAVRLTGRLEPEGVRRVLADSDMYIAPARLESFGLAALEARCVGIPVIGLRGTGLAEFVRNGHEGQLCEDDHDLVATVRRLIDNPEERLAIAEHNRTEVSPLTWANALINHDEVYRHVVPELADAQRVLG